MTLMDGLELYICVILTIEFVYDYWYNSHENRIKRRRNEKKKVEQPILREGEGGVLQKTEGEVRDMQKATNDVQEKTKS